MLRTGDDGSTSGAGALRGAAPLAAAAAVDASSAATALCVTFSPNQTPPAAPAIKVSRTTKPGGPERLTITGAELRPKSTVSGKPPPKPLPPDSNAGADGGAGGMCRFAP